MPAPCFLIFWATPSRLADGLSSVNQPQTQTLKELISQLPRTCSLVFLHKNFQSSSCHVWQDKVIFWVHLSRKTCVVPWGLTELCFLGKGGGKPERKAQCSFLLLLLPGVKGTFLLGPTQHSVGKAPSPGSAGQSHNARWLTGERGEPGTREGRSKGGGGEPQKCSHWLATGQP